MVETIKINSLPTLTTLLKVAAYARVSNGKDAMLHSLSEQVSYYNRYIQEHDGWQFAGIYADEAISGTKENRDEFQRMLMDAYEGKIDLIITKSISRFARNTMTLLETIKKLKKHNVNVFFEEQNLYSMSGECEMILTMLASFAQEEARSVSENMKWKIRKDFEEGLLWGGNNAYGYRIENRRYVIVPEEASLVKHIFNLYLEGRGITAIALKLNKMNIPAYFGGKWNFSSVQNILKNETYTGDLILQKTFRTDYISKKRKMNRGEKDKFLISNDHEAIISRSDFNKVQQMIKSKSKRYNVPDNCYSYRYPFSGMIECSECHKTYIHRKKHCIDKWGCQSAEQYGRAYCKTSDAISNSTLEEVTAKVLNLDKFDEKLFKSEILKIISKPNHLLTFIFKDGSERDITWSNPSRSKSWNPEMKEVARQRSLNLNKKRGEDGRWLKKITIIPSTINPLTQTPVGSVQKRKVAAYARVSTDSDEQYTSYETQKTYYENYIKSKPEWEFVRVYADEGISGTNTKKREGFKSMITDALDGKIDLIVTKSISRFARNTLDTISYIRKLKSAGVEVYFEKENLWSLDSKSEFVLTIMASIAQEESRSISMNVTLGKRWQMQEGKVSFAYSRMLGFKKTENGYAIDKEQAKIVKEIYTDFLIWGMTSTGIANKLTKRGVKTPSGKSEWSKNNIESILTNEKYKGDALLQKTYVVDYLEHKVAMNKGEITQYYVKDSHEAIIDKAEWDMVQDEIKRRKELGATYSASSIFISKLVCGDCGGIYGKKLWHSNDDYRSVRYLCNNKYKDKNKRCITPALTEKTIIDAFIKAYNSVTVDKNSLIEDAEAIKLLLSDTSKIDTEMDKLNTELQVINGLVDHLVRDNSSRLQSQEEYQKKYNELVTRYQNAKTRYEELSIEKSRKEFQSLRLDMFISKIKESPSLITEWNMEIWSILVDKAIVNSNCSITFRFRNGVEKTIKVKKC